jgi:hypothetical protein
VTRLFSTDSALDLREKLAALNVEVPPRSQGRTKAHTERYSIAHLLSSLPAEQFAFPLALEHGDRPDFVVALAERSIGIELTEAVPENVARASALRESGIGPEVYFVPRALPGEPPRRTAELRREIEQDNPGSPWVGNAPEREWADAMFHFAGIKAEKAHKPGFAAYALNWLLIYDNWPLPRVRYAEASLLFAALRADGGILSTFDRVFVLASKVLVEVGSTVELHVVRTPGREPHPNDCVSLDLG